MARKPTNVNEALRLIRDADLALADDREQVRESLEFLDEVDRRQGLDPEVRQFRNQAREALEETEKTAEGGGPGGRNIREVQRGVDEFAQGLQAQGLDAPDSSTLRPDRLEDGPRRVSRPGGPTRPDPAPSLPGQPPVGPTAQEPASQGDERQAVEDALAQQGADLDDPTTQALVDELMGDGEAADPFVGVPQDHRAPGTPDPLQGPVEVSRPGESATRGQPIYRQSDIEDPFGWSTTRIADLQDRMVKAGLLSKGEFRRGWFDEATGQAYGRVLGFANQRGQNQWVALDALAQQRDEEIEDAAAGFVPDLELPPDRASLRSRARETLIGIGRRPSEIDEEEIAEMADVMSGEFKRARQVEEQRQRTMHEAAVSAEFGRDVDPDLAGLEQVDPIARFDEWFRSDEGFGGEIETRDTSAKVARAGQNFERGISSMRQQVRSGGA